MAFTNYTIIPSDEVVILDGVGYAPVDMTGIGATVHAIVWNGDRGVGSIEYEIDPVTGVLPTPGSFTDPADYFNQTEACENPLVVYALDNNTPYGDYFYQAGQQLNIYQWPHPAVPAGFTEDAPFGSSGAYDTWQFDGTNWISAPFPITYTLAQAQTYLDSLVNTQGAAFVYGQLRNYSILQILAAADPNALLPADSVTNLYPTIGDYQTAVDAQVAPKIAEIAAATTTSELYTFDPTVTAPPNYTP